MEGIIELSNTEFKTNMINKPIAPMDKVDSIQMNLHLQREKNTKKEPKVNARDQKHYKRNKKCL